MIFTKKSSITLLYLLLFLLVNGQNKHFNARKFIIASEIGGMPYIGNYQIGEAPTDVNLRYAIRSEHFVSNLLSVGFKFHKTEDVVNLSTFSVSAHTPSQKDMYPTIGLGQVQSIESEANYSYYGVGSFLRIYTKPLDSINKMRLFYNLEYQIGKVKVYDDGRFYNNDQTDIYSLITQNFIFGVGINRIFFKHLSLDFSMNFGYTHPGRNAVSSRKLSSFTNPRSDRFISDIRAKAFSDHIITAKFGIGWLF